MSNDTDKKPEQNYIAGNALKGSDLADREEEIVREIAASSGFVVDKLISRSGWWDHSGPIGAFHYSGTFEGKPAIMKVQGIKPSSSEAYHIERFQQNAHAASVPLRPPHLYFHMPWNDSKRYEVLILEALSGAPVVGVPTTAHQLSIFFQAYYDYRKVLTQEPWVEADPNPLHILVPKRIQEWVHISTEKFGHHPLRKSSDAELIQEGSDLLAKRLVGIHPEFQHGHFSHLDIYKEGSDSVVLSNLYWSWRMPLYDAVFGYHWHRFSLPGVSGITTAAIDNQQALWMSYLSTVPQKLGYSEASLKMVLLERAIAGIVLDGLSADRHHPVTPYILDSVRDEISRLIVELQ